MDKQNISSWLAASAQNGARLYNTHRQVGNHSKLYIFDDPRVICHFWGENTLSKSTVARPFNSPVTKLLEESKRGETSTCLRRTSVEQKKAPYFEMLSSQNPPVGFKSLMNRVRDPIF